MKLFNLGANTIFRKRVLDLTGHVTVDIAKTVNNQDYQN